MRLGITSLCGATPGVDDPMAELIALASVTEDLGFHGFWVTDSQGRGEAKLEPLTVLTVAAAVTRRIEIGTCILQVPLRHPVELAHRARTLDVLSGRRLRFGVGPGSTKADFDLTGNDFAARHATFRGSLETMRRIWRGEANHGVVLEPWPGVDDPPALLLGAWRSEKAIARAAQTADGWIASGIHSTWEDLERGLNVYRAAGGTRAILANVPMDLGGSPEDWPFAAHAAVSLVCAPAVARDRLKRVQDLGMDDVLVVCREASRARLEDLRGLL